jgi:hypothetical protein
MDRVTTVISSAEYRCEKRPAMVEIPKCGILTCSEVVERLAKCYQPFAESHGQNATFGMRFDTEQATAILHSWRERRVQELEELLAKHSLSPELPSTQLDTDKGESMTTETRLTEQDEKLLRGAAEISDADVARDSNELSQWSGIGRTSLVKGGGSHGE